MLLVKFVISEAVYNINIYIYRICIWKEKEDIKIWVVYTNSVDVCG